ncbi:hypothetical protein [Pseudomonas yamanorum]|uniref:hypothetical protein n=1 Tax=Pseudomonas yamanorum TaxID=515393 RepID=UPI00210C918E|nr:hypothetical protein [Pseudomonas yamanorum]
MITLSRNNRTANVEHLTDDTIQFYCKLEDDNAIKDYLKGGRCLRFTGIKSSEWNEVSLREGVTVYIIDVDYWPASQGNRISYAGGEKKSGVTSHNSSAWFLLEFTPGKGRNYYYAAFGSPSEDKPTMGAVVWHRDPIHGPTLPEPPQVKTLSFNSSGEYSLHSFHVGQGMAALIDNGHSGIMLDAGAGCPIRRVSYPDLATNDFRDLVCALDEVIMILSHPDLDHWRLMQWDSTLADNVDIICVPTQTKQLVFSDKSVNEKIRVFTGTLITLNSNTSLDVFRSKPIHSDQNGECQVCTFHKGQHTVLIPGDYVYERINQDKNTHISNLLNTSYTAIIVPHHGDLASGNQVFTPKTPESIAFFSAGTHRGYNHPNPLSLDAHKTKGFKLISNRDETDILKVKLC